MDKQPLVIEQRIRDMMQYGHAAHANTWRLRCSLFNISSGANR